MARYAKVDVRIWGDEKVAKMTPIPPCGQGLWIRLLISQHRSTVPGILCVGEAALAEEFGWTLEAFREAFREASSKGIVKADWKARFVWIPNAKFYNRPESPNVVKSWRIPWDEAPECSLKEQAYRELKDFIEGFAKGFQKAFEDSCSKPSPNQEQEQEQEQEISLSSALVNVNAKSAHDWLCYFNARFWSKKGKQRGCSSDAKATANLQDQLNIQSEQERAEDWIARERIVDEFLDNPDPATARSGWKFAFFVSSFDGLRIPPSRRPKPAPAQSPYQRPQVVYSELKGESAAEVEARRKRWAEESAKDKSA